MNTHDRKMLNQILRKIREDFEHDKYYLAHTKLSELIQVTDTSEIPLSEE